jgi:hypothetical protein
MQKRFGLLALPTFALALGIYAAPIGQQQQAAAGKTTVTGCLQKGDEAGEYSITGQDGKTYGLRSKSVNLSKHLGHKVTVMGTLKPESEENEKAEAKEHANKEKKEAAEAGDISVTSLKMISESCQ